MNSVVVREPKEQAKADRVRSTCWSRAVHGALLALCVLLSACGVAPRPSRPSTNQASHQTAVVHLRLSGASAALAYRLHVQVCSEVWTGPRTGGSWGTSRDWSQGRVPIKSDMACVRRGVTIALSGGHYVVGSLIDGGTTVITHGSLLIADSRVVSQFAVMRVADGQLTWAGIVDSGTLDASDGSRVISGTPAGARPQRRLLACLPGYTPQTIDSYCGPRFDKPPGAQALRARWTEFATQVNLAAALPAAAARMQYVIGSMLATRGCGPSLIGPAGGSGALPEQCRTMIHHVVTDAMQRQLGTRLTGLTLSGHHASARAQGAAAVHFVATAAGSWLISNVDANGPSRYGGSRSGRR
jgi:hypothetical protein